MMLARIPIAVTLTLATGLLLAELGATTQRKPSLSLRASPTVAFASSPITLTAELRHVDANDAQFYCPAIEWDWGDGTRSSATSDCEPFEPGVSEVKTRYVRQHRFTMPGQFRVVVRLRRGTETLLASSTTVTIRPGAMNDLVLP